MRVLRAAALILLFGLANPAAADDGRALRDEAFGAAQFALATTTGKALAQLGARLAAGDGALAAIVRRRQDLVGQWQERDRLLLEELGRSDPQSLARADNLRITLAQTVADIEALDASLRDRFPDYSDLVNPRPLAIGEVQALLRPGEALVLILVTAPDTYVWAVSPRASAWHRAGLAAPALSEVVANLRRGLDPGGAIRGAVAFDAPAPDRPTGPVPAFDRGAAYGLYRDLLAPLAPVLEGSETLFVVTDGALTSLPLSVLVMSPPSGADDDPAALRRTDWLVRRHGLATLPSVDSLKALRGPAARPAAGSEPFRGFGAPRFAAPGDTGKSVLAGLRSASSYFRGGLADVSALRTLPPLPATGPELRHMAAALGAPASAVVLGAAATETAVKQADLSRARVLALATHGLVAGELDGLSEPALAFTPPDAPSALDDGLLTASEAAQLNLAADWVVLSACNTAASDGTPGADGLSGLARAFIYAGARAILVSHWPVRDDAAAALTGTAFAEMAGDATVGRAGALRRSMLALMADERDPTLAHPSAWAPFVVVGEGGR